MTSPAVGLTVVSGGINRLRTKGGPDKNSLYDLLNGYVTASNTVKVRPGTTRNASLDPNTKGLVYYQGGFHTFSHELVNVPNGYQLHILNHPALASDTTGVDIGGASGSLAAYTVESVLNFDDGNGATTFVDTGAGGLAWTAHGAAAESTAQARFGTGSLHANALADYISAPITVGGPLDISDLATDATVEFYYYPTNISGGNEWALLDFGTASGSMFQLYQINGVVTLAGGSTHMQIPSVLSNPLVLNAWNHIAVTKTCIPSLGTAFFRIFVNGITSDGAGNENTNFGWPALGSATTFTLGRCPVAVSNSLGAGGYFDGFRVTKGRAVYGGQFTLPFAAPSTTPVFAYTVASLLHFDDGNGSTAFTDAAPSAPVWAQGGSNGTATESTAQSKFGAGSLYFSATAQNAYIDTPITLDGPLDLSDGDGDFTVEYWVYPPTLTPPNTDEYHIGAIGNSGNKGWGDFYMTATGTMNWVWPNGSGVLSSSAKLVANQWNHVAAVRSGARYQLYVNGTGSTIRDSFAAQLQYTGSNNLQLGAQVGATTTGSQNLYMDEVRIVKGLAVYNANFTPPTAAFVTSASQPIPIKEIHFAAPYLGYLFVVAEFNPLTAQPVGDIFGYWVRSASPTEAWQANSDYQIGDVILPVVPNGLFYIASRKSAPNPVWTAGTIHALNDKVEPTEPNGFYFTATTVTGANPVSGQTEPTWPTTDGGTVQEFSSLAADQTVTLVTSAPQATAVTNATPVRYKGTLV